MKLHRPKAPHLRLLRPKTLKRYYKWALWLSLSIYLFLSSLPSSPTTSLPTTTLPSTTTPRALVETVFPNPNPNFPSIFIYNLPPHYNTNWLTNPRCSTHLFASEVAIHTALLTSPHRTLDPASADLFFVPVYVSCNFSTVNGFPSLSHARTLLSQAIADISAAFPFWERYGGRDHVFVASHDYGACFHAMEDVAVAAGIPGFLRSSILLQTFGVRGSHACQEAEHVLIPPYVAPGVAETVVVEAARRDIFVFFRGKMEVHPKNISGRFYGRQVRTNILRHFGANRRFHLKRHRFDGYRSEIARSVFCLCPLGWAPWSPRLVESVLLGCIPVIMADNIRLPFPDVVPWPEISLTVPEKEVHRLEKVLDKVVRTNLTSIQKRLWDPKVRNALTFHRRMREGDATWQVLKALAGKVGRGWGRPTVGGHVD